MAEAFKVSSNAAQIVRRFSKYSPEVKRSVRQSLGRRLIIVEGRVQRKTGIKSRRGAAGLMGRLTSFAKTDPYLGIDAAIGFRKTKGFPYELAQEFGAHAKPGKAMAIPISPEAKRLSNRGVSARDFPRKLIMPRGGFRGSKNILIEPTFSKKAGIQTIVHYVLVKKIAPRLNFRRTIFQSMQYISDGIVAGHKEALGKL